MAAVGVVVVHSSVAGDVAPVSVVAAAHYVIDVVSLAIVDVVAGVILTIVVDAAAVDAATDGVVSVAAVAVVT